MSSGNAIRGTRVGAGPMGESERGETAPRRRVSYWCANGHEWGPGLITVNWMPCECGPAAAARQHGPGHVVVYCEAVMGCRSAWYQPRHEPER